MTITDYPAFVLQYFNPIANNNVADMNFHPSLSFTLIHKVDNKLYSHSIFLFLHSLLAFCNLSFNFANNLFFLSLSFHIWPHYSCSHSHSTLLSVCIPLPSFLLSSVSHSPFSPRSFLHALYVWTYNQHTHISRTQNT